MYSAGKTHVRMLHLVRGYMDNRKKKKRKLFLMLLCMLAVLCAGCRTSPVLEQIIYQQNEEPDKDNDTNSVDNDEENEEEDDQLAAKETVDDSDTNRDQSKEDAVSGDQKEEADKAYEGEYQEKADSVGADSQGQVASSETKGNGTSSNSEKQQDNGAGGQNETTDDEKQETAAPSEPSETEPETEPQTEAGGQNEPETEETPAENPDSPESVDETESNDSGEDDGEGGNGNLENGETSGEEYEPVEEITYKQVVDARGVSVDVPENVDGVTAVGEAATIVEMLGGSGRLIASSGSFTGNSLAASAFSSQGFSSVRTWWDGNGSGTISSGNFSALLEAAPDACFEISGQSTFNSSQIEAMQEAGIAYVVLPSFTSIENIKSAVQIVGAVLGDRSSDGGTNAPSIASSYASWANDVIGKVQGRGSAKYTLYISEWDSSAYWEIKNNVNGVWQSGYGAAVGRKNANSSPLNACMSAANLTNRASDNVYINPLRNNYWLNYYSGGSGSFNYGENLTSVSGVGLGNEAFPAIVVANSSIKANIQSDIHWQVYGWEMDGAGNSGFGFNDGNGNIVGTTIEGAYDIYVNPDGVGSWVNGSVESPLEAAWLSCKFQNGCSMDELRSMVSNFYSTFYHTSVSTSSILGE